MLCTMDRPYKPRFLRLFSCVACLVRPHSNESHGNNNTNKQHVPDKSGMRCAFDPLLWEFHNNKLAVVQGASTTHCTRACVALLPCACVPLPSLPPGTCGWRRTAGLTCPGWLMAATRTTGTSTTRRCMTPPTRRYCRCMRRQTGCRWVQCAAAVGDLYNSCQWPDAHEQDSVPMGANRVPIGYQ